jgi:hypothetical protein
VKRGIVAMCLAGLLLCAIPAAATEPDGLTLPQAWTVARGRALKLAKDRHADQTAVGVESCKRHGPQTVWCVVLLAGYGATDIGSRDDITMEQMLAIVRKRGHRVRACAPAYDDGCWGTGRVEVGG